MNIFLIYCFLGSIIVHYNSVSSACFIPPILRGSWFSLEADVSTHTVIDYTNVSGRGFCVDMKVHYNETDDEHFRTYVFKKIGVDCHYCVRFFIRNSNVFEKVESSCISLPSEVRPTVENVCSEIKEDQPLITSFKEDHVPVPCKSSLEGSWHFTYQDPKRFSGTCNESNALIQSCQITDTGNRKFNMTYKQCQGIEGTFNGLVDYNCLGDWYVGDKHYFVVANTRESRDYQKYRCFVKNRNDDLSLGVSTTAECNTLKSPEDSPEHLKLTPVRTEYIEPGCTLPQNFIGEWVDPENTDADVVISESHINITEFPNTLRSRRTTYVCVQQHNGTGIMMARLAPDSCQKDFVCFYFLSRHHNIIHYRKGLLVQSDDYKTVCSRFSDYSFRNYFYAKNPVPVRCPIAGRFNIAKSGEFSFKKRDYTINARAPVGIHCNKSTSVLSICDTNRTEIALYESNCLTADELAQPVADNKLKCIGYWRDNRKLVLITYDELDVLSKYRCWNYIRVGADRLLLSVTVGANCNTFHYLTSGSLIINQGAVAAIDANADKKISDECPMDFDDGASQWRG